MRSGGVRPTLVLLALERSPKENNTVAFLLLRPNVQVGVPRASAQRLTVVRDPEARHAVVVALQRLAALASQNVPQIARKVIVTCKQKATRHGEANAGDSAQDVLVRVAHQLKAS